MHHLPAIRKVIAAHLVYLARLDDLTPDERQMLVESYLDEVYRLGRRRKTQSTIPQSTIPNPQ